MKIITNIDTHISKEIPIGVTHCIYKELKETDKEHAEECIKDFCKAIVLDVTKNDFKNNYLDNSIFSKNQLEKLVSAINKRNYTNKHFIDIIWDSENNSFTCNWDRKSNNTLPERFSFSIPLSNIRIRTLMPTKCIIEYSNKVKISNFMKELNNMSLTITLHERYFDFEHEEFKQSPLLEHIEGFMERINLLYKNHYVSHWFNIKKQTIHFRIREKTWMEHNYNRKAFIDWLKIFLPDFREDIREIRNNHGQHIYLLGKSKQLNIAAIETERELPKQSMREIAKEHAINNFFEVNITAGYSIKDKWWRLEFWWSEFQISNNGTVSKKQKAWVPGSTKTWHYFGEKKILPGTYDISNDREYKNLILGKAKSVDDIIEKMDISKESIPPLYAMKDKKYQIVDFYTNINPTNHSVDSLN